jgi:3'-phosphoadenosine 5'-phosphosulfate sulfotransferase (PAPS reductase)/FAD synthetase
MSKDKIALQEFEERINWPLDRKIQETNERIELWVQYWGKDAYISFSGGLDSTVLLDLARNHPRIDGESLPAYFADTGTEYPDIRRFVRSIPNIAWVQPKIKFHKVLEKYGYPVVSKNVSKYVKEVQRAKTAQVVRLRLTGWRKDGTHSPMSKIPHKWQFLIGAPFNVSDMCCYHLKKRPLKNIGAPIVGVRAAEAKNRKNTYLRTGCNAFEISQPRSWPMAFWTDRDVKEYIAIKSLRYCPIYDMGYRRTGCFSCAFGIHLEPWPNRFQLMQKTHPRLWDLCMDRYGFQPVLEFMNDWLPKNQKIAYRWKDYSPMQLTKLRKKFEAGEIPKAVEAVEKLGVGTFDYGVYNKCIPLKRKQIGGLLKRKQIGVCVIDSN